MRGNHSTLTESRPAGHPERRLRPCVAAVCAVWLALGGCTSWETTRDEVVLPINALIHVRYPKSFREMSPDSVAALYVPEERDRATRDAREILAPFRRIDGASCSIGSATPTDGEGRLTANVVLRLDGIDAQGRRRSVYHDEILRCVERENVWWIAARERGETRVAVESGPTFVDEAVERGIDFTQRSGGVEDRNGDVQPYVPGSGLAIRDVDGDDFEDVLLVGGRELKLFMNRNGRFREESAERGIEPPATGECRFAVFGDVDNDGDPDLFVGVLGARDVLFLNQGGGRFREQDTAGVGLLTAGQATGASFADFDGDGDLDLYVANGASLLEREPSPIHSAKNAFPNLLFSNQGDGTFVDVTDRAGVGDSGWALACTTADYDSDGDVDLFVANDFGKNVLYRNRGDGIFDDVTAEAGIGVRASNMGASFGDVDGDGHSDLFVTAMASNSAWIVDQPGFPAPAPFPIGFLFRGAVLEALKEMLGGNWLFMSRGDGTFTEVSTLSGTRHSGWAWGGVFFDYDNDGRLDIYVPNGLVSGEDSADL